MKLSINHGAALAGGNRLYVPVIRSHKATAAAAEAGGGAVAAAAAGQVTYVVVRPCRYENGRKTATADSRAHAVHITHLISSDLIRNDLIKAVTRGGRNYGVFWVFAHPRNFGGKLSHKNQTQC